MTLARGMCDFLKKNSKSNGFLKKMQKLMFFKDFSCECQKNVVPLLQEKIKKRRYAKYGHDRGCTVYRRCCNRIHMVQVQSRYRLAHYASTVAIIQKLIVIHKTPLVFTEIKQKPIKPFECFCATHFRAFVAKNALKVNFQSFLSP